MEFIRKRETGILAFSLAEALITLLIVAIITLASIPVITKKHRAKDYDHGSWYCTKNSAGQHVSYSSKTGTWKVEGQQCTFTPPANTRNYEVIAVGGGGGGASGYTKKEIKRLYGNGTNALDFYTEAAGEYEITLIGGGGQGGDRKNNERRCRENAGGPGGSGGFRNAILKLDKNKSYRLFAGPGGRGGDYNGGSGQSSYISLNGSKILEATGGGGGAGRWGPACGKGNHDYANSDWGRRGDAGSPNGVTGLMQKSASDKRSVHTTGGILCRTNSRPESYMLKGYRIAGMDCNKILTDKNYMETSAGGSFASGSGYSSFTVYGLPYGYGGHGQDSNGGREDGGPGLVIFRYNIIYSGQGGKAANPDRPPIYSQIKKVVARVGAGGSGAANINSSGSNGSRTDYIVQTQDREINRYATGGDGGEPQYLTRASADATGYLAGEQGGTSEVKPFKSVAVGGYGGFSEKNPANINGATLPFIDKDYFGAGGGGGGANDTTWGKGGNGAPGAVLINW